jgi:hypothetical protein
MKDLHSILVVVDRNGGAEQAVGKAVSLARQFGARMSCIFAKASKRTSWPTHMTAPAWNERASCASSRRKNSCRSSRRR